MIRFLGKNFVSKDVEIDTTYYFSDALYSSVSNIYIRAHNILGVVAGEQEKTTPKHSFAVWNSYKHNNNGSYGFGIRYESERNDLSTRNPDILIEEYVEINAGAYYVLNNSEISFVLSDALDKKSCRSGGYCST
jgi:outer membrane receptor for monomeric catechols